MGSPVVYRNCVHAPAAGSCAGAVTRLASWRLLLSRLRRAAACRCSCSSRSSSCAAVSFSLASFSCASTTHRGSTVQSAAKSSSSSASSSFCEWVRRAFFVVFGRAAVSPAVSRAISSALSARRCRACCRCHITLQTTTAAAAPAALAGSAGMAQLLGHETGLVDRGKVAREGARQPSNQVFAARESQITVPTVTDLVEGTARNVLPGQRVAAAASACGEAWRGAACCAASAPVPAAHRSRHLRLRRTKASPRRCGALVFSEYVRGWPRRLQRRTSASRARSRRR